MKRTIRFLIDWIAITAGGVVTGMATGSFIGAVVGAVAITAYSLWCYNDGAST